MAWEALVEQHVVEANEFVSLLRDRLDMEDALARYLAEMDLDETMATAVRTRVLVALEPVPEPAAPAAETAQSPTRVVAPRPMRLPSLPAAGVDDQDDAGWRRFRPDALVRGMRRRQQRSDETETMIELALARAEEAIMQTHVDNAIGFTALLDDYVGIGRAVSYYLGAVVLTGSRAHSVLQRTMARLADVHLPR
ncbi:MAG TPA: hypothetical protein VFU06_14175 [Longimicrobiales bacterium]|nr:hypothetical protein [Longimicrobiales bacterium]